MPSVKTNLKAISELVEFAECAYPDTQTGRDWLYRIQDDVVERIAYERPLHFEDLAFEVADAAVPVYTRDLWNVFTDLAAHQEDPSELGYDSSDMTQAAKVCLYIIAERLAYALIAEFLGEDDDVSD